eukprot:Pgem_evm1s201
MNHDDIIDTYFNVKFLLLYAFIITVIACIIVAIIMCTNCKKERRLREMKMHSMLTRYENNNIHLENRLYKNNSQIARDNPLYTNSNNHNRYNRLD